MVAEGVAKTGTISAGVRTPSVHLAEQVAREHQLRPSERDELVRLSGETGFEAWASSHSRQAARVAQIGRERLEPILQRVGEPSDAHWCAVAALSPSVQKASNVDAALWSEIIIEAANLLQDRGPGLPPRLTALIGPLPARCAPSLLKALAAIDPISWHDVEGVAHRAAEENAAELERHALGPDAFDWLSSAVDYGITRRTQPYALPPAEVVVSNVGVERAHAVLSALSAEPRMAARLFADSPALGRSAWDVLEGKDGEAVRSSMRRALVADALRGTRAFLESSRDDGSKVGAHALAEFLVTSNSRPSEYAERLALAVHLDGRTLPALAELLAAAESGVVSHVLDETFVGHVASLPPSQRLGAVRTELQVLHERPPLDAPITERELARAAEAVAAQDNGIRRLPYLGGGGQFDVYRLGALVLKRPNDFYGPAGALVVRDAIAALRADSEFAAEFAHLIPATAALTDGTLVSRLAIGAPLHGVDEGCQGAAKEDRDAAVAAAGCALKVFNAQPGREAISDRNSANFQFDARSGRLTAWVDPVRGEASGASVLRGRKRPGSNGRRQRRVGGES